ncbi:hypothetical protein LCGC14_1191770 [marine sediment metagenome]|uniref:Uncharacterized protein n=1 Tax=marine sediment metagenome TaxID=412755 RepID=A0A0F9M6Y1_9ZZZZ
MNLPADVFNAVEWLISQGFTRDGAIEEIEERYRLLIPQDIKDRIPR